MSAQPINTSITKTSTPAVVQPGTTNTVASQPFSIANAPVAASPNFSQYQQAPVSIPSQTTQNTGYAGDTINQNIGQRATNVANQGTTYPGLVNLNTENSLAGSPVAGQAASGLIASGQSDPLTSSAAYAKYLADTQAYQNLQGSIAKTYGNLETGDQSLPVVLGQEGALQKQYGGQLSALQTGIQNDLALTGQSISEQQTQQSGLNSAGQLGIAGQGQLQSGLATSIGAAAPQSYSPTNVPYNPLTQSFGNFAGASNGGGLSSVGAALQQQQQGADVQTMKSAYAQTDALINNFNNNLPSSMFNQSPLALGNQLTQWLKTGVVPDPQYANAINTLQEIASTIAPVLGTPGAPTDLKTVIANELVPRLMQGQDISTVLKNLEGNAMSKINAADAVSKGTSLNSGQQNPNDPLGIL